MQFIRNLVGPSYIKEEDCTWLTNIPGQFTTIRLPSIFEVLLIRAAEFDTVKFLLDKGT